VLVDNNFYTNLMARENLRDALQAINYLKKNRLQTWEKLKERLKFLEVEAEQWEKIIENMYFPYDEILKIYPMDDGFMMRKPWDESKIPPEKRAWLYENYHPLFIMRHRMSKQADAILGMYLHSNLFSEEEIRRNYDFYQKVTLHHSSLSTCIFGIVASGIGYLEEAYDYFSQSARMDLDDYHNNFYAGIHAANMAGTWQAIVNGFAGMRCQNTRLEFKPTIPEEWDEYTFRILYRKALLKVKISKNEARFTLLEGENIVFYVKEKEIEITKRGETYVQKI
jgi:alpha,alpha-trehalose phosphorylase